MYRFLASTRWIGWLLLVCLFATTFTFLGKWQMDRREGALTEISHVKRNYDAEPVPFAEARQLFEQLPAESKWTPVSLRGSYLAEDQVVVRNRISGSRPGYEVLVPFRTLEGTVVIVDRGFLPIGNDQAGRPDAVPAPPAGTVEVDVRLKGGEPKLDRGAPEGQLASIDLPTYEQQLGYPVATGSYGLMYLEDPAAAEAPIQLQRPEEDEGPHLSYMFQWFAFGVLVFVGFGYAARQQARINREDRDEVAAAALRGEEPVLHQAHRMRKKPKKLVRRDGSPTDEATEDAYLDELERRAAERDAGISGTK
ncbi:SURF1 family cytochrome oxidase biogenesis protein [Paeniglutamicibacter psychrophenolicus]|uniref:SURF1 family cytochrome oxidase biogenesis protein n=1 Tax=Paeniglutamicibacter psychrophenolicus TaxID=257454 RepID=UPI00278300DC|nr:SURF1 family protein [Paeniglutamicibacter psychrophenolicus]MDQ0093483.1 cytochrome oxidase assembly protein ShyY1 [Paeniglutamicibacter psychrophenolicus]